jgi:hypothetical protein
MLILSACDKNLCHNVAVPWVWSVASFHTTITSSSQRRRRLLPCVNTLPCQCLVLSSAVFVCLCCIQHLLSRWYVPLVLSPVVEQYADNKLVQCSRCLHHPPGTYSLLAVSPYVLNILFVSPSHFAHNSATGNPSGPPHIRSPHARAGQLLPPTPIQHSLHLHQGNKPPFCVLHSPLPSVFALTVLCPER